MINADAARTAMIKGQVRTNDVTDKRLQDALAAVPRERFAPKSKRSLAYAEMELTVAEGRWLPRPRDFAKLVEALAVKPGDVVLDVACGRGYSTAVLAQLAETVIGLEDDRALVERAGALLVDLGIDNAVIVFGALAEGVADQGPFDVIFVNGAVEEAPDAWLAQLADGGRLGVVTREGPVGKARVFTRAGDTVSDRHVFDSSASLLPGFAKPAAFEF